MANSFGVSGLRGEANVSLTVDLAFSFGRFLGCNIRQQTGRKPRIVIGRDTRISGPMLQSAMASGLMASGADVYLMEVTTTPSVSFITKTDGFDCGIMITASHNPYQDNGIKVINSDGEAAGEGIFVLFQDYVEGRTGNIPYAQRHDIGVIYDYSCGREKYYEHLLSVPDTRFKGLRIGLDCANGASSDYAERLFTSLGAEVIVINDAPDGFNINEKCGSSHLEVIRKLVLENKLDAGFAFDGDADRCMGIDENGNEVSGDHVSYIYASFLKKQGRLNNNVVVGTVISNLGLFKALDAAGISYIRTGVGEPLVSKAMKDSGCLIGGEQCGHMVFSEYSNTGDGMITAMKMLDVMVQTHRSLGELAGEITIYPQITENIRVNDKKAAMADEDIQKTIQEVSQTLGDSGRVLVRNSDTESLIRIMVEARSSEDCKMYADRIAQVLYRKGYATQ
ncbi:MAG: phosphoglucosamine mutase [Spirochaetales bacterium]|nr:phosphoglucosamine mutase [Spirochaetales bacterium]